MKAVISWLSAAAVSCSVCFTDARSQLGKEQDICLNSKTEIDLGTCRRDALTLSQAKLDRSIEDLRLTYAKAEPAKARLLDDAQGAWIRFRDAQCRFQTADSATGTAAELYLATCLTQLNSQRSDDLSRIQELP